MKDLEFEFKGYWWFAHRTAPGRIGIVLSSVPQKKKSSFLSLSGAVEAGVCSEDEGAALRARVLVWIEGGGDGEVSG
jgi:hypothetical protein